MLTVTHEKCRNGVVKIMTFPVGGVIRHISHKSQSTNDVLSTEQEVSMGIYNGVEFVGAGTDGQSLFVKDRQVGESGDYDRIYVMNGSGKTVSQYNL